MPPTAGGAGDAAAPHRGVVRAGLGAGGQGADAAGAAGRPQGQGGGDRPARTAADGAEHEGVGMAAAVRRLGEEARGRGAATLARLLGCSPSGARKVLVPLTEAGAAARHRKATATRMNGRGKVMLLPVARAYGHALAPVEAVSQPGTVSSARPDGACGDHAPAGTDCAFVASGIGGAERAGNAADRERPDGAQLHTDHVSMVTPLVPARLDFSALRRVPGPSGKERAGPLGAVRQLPRRDEQSKRAAASVDNREPAGRLRGDGVSMRQQAPVTDEFGRSSARAAGSVLGSRCRLPPDGGRQSRHPHHRDQPRRP